MKDSSNDALDSRGYSSTSTEDAEEWGKLRGLSEKEASESLAAARHRKKNLAVLLLLVGLLGFLASQPLLLPDRLLGALAVNVQDSMESVFPEDSGPIIPPSAAEEAAAQPVTKTKAAAHRTARAGMASATAAAPSAQPTAAAPAPQSQPFSGGVQVAQTNPHTPFGVEVVDNRDRRYSPAPRERVIALGEKGTDQRIEVDPNVSERMRITPGPVISKEADVNGSVRLRAVISTDGAIKELAVVSGPAELGPAAIQVARQWRYRPYYFNGRPVETETYITINFNISTN